MAWQLVPQYIEVEYLLKSGTSLRARMREGLTAYGDAAPLTLAQQPSQEIVDASTYVFLGGYEYVTDDPAIRDLWIASGFEVLDV